MTTQGVLEQKIEVEIGSRGQLEKVETNKINLERPKTLLSTPRFQKNRKQ